MLRASAKRKVPMQRDVQTGAGESNGRLSVGPDHRRLFGMALGQRQSAPHTRPARRATAPYHSGAHAHRDWGGGCSGLPGYCGNPTSTHPQGAQDGDLARGAYVKYGSSGTIQCARIGLPGGTTTHGLTSGLSGPARRRPLRELAQHSSRTASGPRHDAGSREARRRMDVR